MCPTCLRNAERDVRPTQGEIAAALTMGGRRETNMAEREQIYATPP
jgi:hypothetical protein